MDWKEAHQEIANLLEDYQIKRIELARAKNKKQKEERNRAMQLVNDRAKKYIHDNDELYMLFAGDSRSDPNSYHSVWDEFHKPNLFEFDIEELLSKIQKKINGQEKD
ncbi:MAG: hypothetical protein AAF090_11655 [Bacteroidota bacterium]